MGDVASVIWGEKETKGAGGGREGEGEGGGGGVARELAADESVQVSTYWKCNQEREEGRAREAGVGGTHNAQRYLALAHPLRSTPAHDSHRLPLAITAQLSRTRAPEHPRHDLHIASLSEEEPRDPLPARLRLGPVGNPRQQSLRNRSRGLKEMGVVDGRETRGAMRVVGRARGVGERKGERGRRRGGRRARRFDQGDRAAAS